MRMSESRNANASGKETDGEWPRSRSGRTGGLLTLDGLGRVILMVSSSVDGRHQDLDLFLAILDEVQDVWRFVTEPEVNPGLHSDTRCSDYTFSVQPGDPRTGPLGQHDARAGP